MGQWGCCQTRRRWLASNESPLSVCSHLDYRRIKSHASIHQKLVLQKIKDGTRGKGNEVTAGRTCDKSQCPSEHTVKHLFFSRTAVLPRRRLVTSPTGQEAPRDKILHVVAVSPLGAAAAAAAAAAAIQLAIIGGDFLEKKGRRRKESLAFPVAVIPTSLESGWRGTSSHTLKRGGAGAGQKDPIVGAGDGQTDGRAGGRWNGRPAGDGKRIDRSLIYCCVARPLSSFFFFLVVCYLVLVLVLVLVPPASKRRLHTHEPVRAVPACTCYPHHCVIFGVVGQAKRAGPPA